MAGAAAISPRPRRTPAAGASPSRSDRRAAGRPLSVGRADHRSEARRRRHGQVGDRSAGLARGRARAGGGAADDGQRVCDAHAACVVRSPSWSPACPRGRRSGPGPAPPTRWSAKRGRRAGDGGAASCRGTDVYGITAKILARGAVRMADPAYDCSGGLAPAQAFEPAAFLQSLVPDGITTELEAI